MLFVSGVLLNHEKCVLNVIDVCLFHFLLFVKKKYIYVRIYNSFINFYWDTHLFYYKNIKIYAISKYLYKYPSAYVLNNDEVFSYDGGILLKVSVLILKDNGSEK